jgi:hypothetical protein
MSYPSDWRVGGVPIVSTSKQTTRILMPDSIITWGRRPAPAPKKDATHTEGQSFGMVYSNDLAREALLSDPRIAFPRGSIIVREKLSQPDALQPDLLTVMVKRQKGFNPWANDWEFLLVDGNGKKVLERQKKGSCLNCHGSQAGRDYVYSPNTTPLNGP